MTSWQLQLVPQLPAEGGTAVARVLRHVPIAQLAVIPLLRRHPPRHKNRHARYVLPLQTLPSVLQPELSNPL